MSQAVRRLLGELQGRGDEGVPRSRVPRTCESLVQELQTCNAVRWRPAGSGQVLCVVNPEAMSAVVDRHFPLGLEDALDAIVDRATSVLTAGDAKLASRGACEGVFIRSTRSSARLRSADSTTEVPVADLTRAAGGAAVLLEDDRGWSFDGTVAVIENAEAFWRHDRVLDVDLAVYSAGRMSSRRLLEWLASSAMGACSFIHRGDYDPIGTAEYLRLAKACPGRVKRHMPEHLDDLIAQHGNRDLLRRQVDVLDQLRSFGDEPTVARLIDLWDRHQRALEQEILLVNDGASNPG